ncbi:MAG: glycosyltransferase family 4 protein [Gemmatimonadales bacterium]
MARGALRILVLSFYYRPDLSAGSFRATALIAALRRRMPPGSHIDVITTLPNRYRSFTAEAPLSEEQPGVSIHRIALERHKSGMLDQSVAFLSYARRALTHVAGRDFDIVFATSSRLMTAVLGAWIARRKRAKLYLDIRDIFADTIKDVLPRAIAAVVKPVFSALEMFALHRADKINVVSPGFLEYFAQRYPHQRFSCFTNGIDPEFLDAAPTDRRPSPRKAGVETLTVVYAGNIGEGQGLHLVVPQLARALGNRVRFKVIGDGGRRQVLETTIAAMGVTNVEIAPPVGREQLLEAYRAADILFLHLNNHAAFDKVLPSKLFEYAALGKPLWAGVSGFAAAFTRHEIRNSAVFQPCDVDSALRSLDELILEDVPRSEFVAKYGRAAISERLAEDVLSVAPDAVRWRAEDR